MNYLGKCENCGKNEAIIVVQNQENPSEARKLCLICAEELGVGQLNKLLELWGYADYDVQEMQNTVNEFFANFSADDSQNLLDLSGLLSDSPDFEEVRAAFQENDFPQALEKLKELGINPMSFDDLAASAADGFKDLQARLAQSKEQADDLSSPETDPDFSLSAELNRAGEDYSSGAAEESPENPDEGRRRNPLAQLFRSWTEGSSGQPEPVSASRQRKRSNTKQKYKYLYQFGVNLNEKARENKIDPIVGREKELARLAQILNRRQKNNPALIGEPGVGKTAIAEGLAKRIVEGKVPAKLLDKDLYLIDMSSMVAGTQFRGQFEARIKGVIEDAKDAGNVILVIDELHNIIAAGDSEGGMNAANILKPALAKGEISVIGATTLDEYRKYIEKDSALERRFQKLMVEEPSAEETFDILQGLKKHYADHHFVLYPDETIGAAIQLSQRYLNERYLPDKAIDILDEAGSQQNLNNELLVKERERELELQLVTKRYQELCEIDASELNDEEREDYFKSRALIQQQQKSLESELEEIKSQLKRYVVSVEDVAKVIEMWTGIPVQQITEEENTKLLKLEERLKGRVIGQDHALQALAKAVRRKRAGFGLQKKPASFLFVGPTGVGKTESVKALTEALFDSEENLIRLDMSEYMEAHTVAKLIGSPPGYIGYDDGGQLSEKVRRHPYSVILFDEIEKAHADVYNILLQILDDGRLSDSQGRVVNFENTVIVLTSNAGTSLKRHGFGFNKDPRPDLEERVTTALREIFRPEFLNRIDETIIFNELDQADLLKIVDLMLADVERDLKLKGIKFKITERAKIRLVADAYDPKFGARPLRRAVQKQIEDPLAEAYLKGELKGKSMLNLDLKENSDQLELDPEDSFSGIYEFRFTTEEDDEA
ncbi:MAG: ATP-dependent Clp protease ATP-binding subunit [Eubacteriales bacterium]|nr:ATP-dependent Clp protease ATP-binding subunit [Eubacteriales bacterium]